jgi:hypothetical protein
MFCEEMELLTTTHTDDVPSEPGAAAASTSSRNALDIDVRHGSQSRTPAILGWAKSIVPLLLLIICVGAVGVLWLIRFRYGQVTGWDESGYVAIAIRDTRALNELGLTGLAKEFERQDVQAPLLPLATVPVNALVGNGVFQSLVTLQAFAAALVAVTYVLARTVLDRGWSLLAAACVGTMPAVADYSRLFVFAVPAAVFLTGCTWALVRSEQLRQRRWVVGAGALAGLMLLSRTMTLSFLPALWVAGLGLLVASPQGDRLRRFSSLVLAGLTTFAVAAIWYLHNAISVAAYLLHYGYGKQAGSFGAAHPATSWAYWAKDIRLAVQSLYLPLAALVLVGSLLAFARYSRSRGALRTALGSPTFVVAIVPVVGYLVLTSSKNEGTGFILPLLPPLTVLAVASAARLQHRMARRGLASLFVIVCASNLLMKSGYVPFLAAPRTLPVPGLGSLPVLDGRGLIQVEVAAAGYPVESPTQPLPDIHKRWLRVMHALTTFTGRYASERSQIPSVVFGSDDQIFNTTRYELAEALWPNHAAHSNFIGVGADSDRVSYYRARLEYLKPNFVEIAQHRPRRGVTGITQRYVTVAVRSLRYRQVYRFRLPDGRQAGLWYRQQPTLVRSESLP